MFADKTEFVSYAMIDKLRDTHPVANLCGLRNVAKRGDQTWSRGIYGPKKIQAELPTQALTAGLNRIKRLRKLHGVRCTHQKKFCVTTDSKHRLPVAENLLNRQFAPSAPNRVWVADITYSPTDEGWLFLAAIKDLYTGEIVGWAMDKQMTKQLVIDALRAARRVVLEYIEVF